jgi:hypothetical protein
MLILFCWQLNAMDRDSTLKIYHEIFTSLSNKKHFSIYTENKVYMNIFSTSKRIHLVSSPKLADIILLTKHSSIKSISSIDCKNKILFATKYTLLKSHSHIIGAFYWRRGRAQLLFIKNRLKAHGISLPNKYREYIRDTL